ncbi:bacterio-opsin activator [Paenibacillus flagellatus]|uniref:Bacterio-opsin activator n=1 Tax=Paenibacillus flagellatus TaxID=2211139 RepID=A0A2V5KGQ8_9BACL|nr:bacterio-opsin activator [Paenibacillus flagellatus]PYI53400.1 bacterio-opsin activator [Paenibacillus flagellatus]
MESISTPGNNLPSRRRVIGLNRELDRLERWLADPHAETKLFSVSGIGGIGKTTLLIEMAQRSRRSSALTLWLDGLNEPSAPAAFLSGLEMGLESEYGRFRAPQTALLPYVISELSRQRTVLLLDNGERLDWLEGWLLSSFLPLLPSAGVLLVIASRSGLSAKWRANPYWGGRIESFPLGLHAREDVVAYLRESGLEPGVQTEIARKTDGHPMLLALTVDLLRSREGESRQGLNEIPAMLTAEWLREAASPPLHRALAVLSLLPAADPSTLNHLLDEPIDASAFQELGTLSFVRATPWGLSLHQVVSRLLRDDYSSRHPEQFRALRHRTLRLLADRFREADRRTRMRIAAHVLELYREFLPSAHAYADFSSVLRPGETEPYRPEDLPCLHRFLADSLARSDWHSELVRAEDCHDVLDEIAGHSPEGICIVRDEGGRPLGFCAGFRLHASTVPLLERYAPSLLPMLGEEGERLRHVPPESADTLCVLLAAVDVGQSLYGPEELGALLMQRWLIEMTSGWRGIMVSADPKLNGLFSMLGFEEKDKIRPAGAAEVELTRWELDFRQSMFDRWVQAFIRQTGPDWMNERNDRERDFRSGNGAEAKVETDEARQILRHLFDVDALERLPVVRRLRIPGAGLQAHVQAILTAEPPPFPLTGLEQRILRDSFLHKELNKNELAEAFHMSRTTFYRHSRQAVSHLAHVLALSLTERSNEAG